MNVRRFALIHIMFHKKISSLKDERDGVWVDGEILRRFVSCDDDMGDLLSNPTQPMLRVQDCICKQHGKGLNPRIAHQGKWLSRTCFEVYLSLLRTEQKLLMEDLGKDSVPWSHNLCDVVITRHNLKCVPCDKLYKESIQEKLNKLGLIRQLYSLNLDTGIDSIAIKSGIEKKVFALSQGFVSKFQKFAMELMKTLTTPKKTNETHSLEQGLDGIYLKDLMPWLHNEETKHMDNDSIDPTVNSKISCKYLSQRSLHNHMVNTIMILTNFCNLCTSRSTWKIQR